MLMFLMRFWRSFCRFLASKWSGFWMKVEPNWSFNTKRPTPWTYCKYQWKSMVLEEPGLDFLIKISKNRSKTERGIYASFFNVFLLIFYGFGCILGGKTEAKCLQKTNKKHHWFLNALEGAPGAKMDVKWVPRTVQKWSKIRCLPDTWLPGRHPKLPWHVWTTKWTIKRRKSNP